MKIEIRYYIKLKGKQYNFFEYFLGTRIIKNNIRNYNANLNKIT